MIGEILVKTLTCLLMSPSFLACWRGMINLIYLFIIKVDKADINMYSYITYK